MNRREFIAASSAAILSALLADSIASATEGELPAEWRSWRAASPLGSGPAPRPEISAAVDVIVPADPEIPGDFKGTDYHADRVVARTLGELGQVAVVAFLDKYARGAAGKKFLACTPDEQLRAIQSWILDRETIQPLVKDMLTGLLTISMIGTYEDNSPAESLKLFQSMGWFDPEDPAGTFHLPSEGYPDSFQFPQKLKKGLQR